MIATVAIIMIKASIAALLEYSETLAGLALIPVSVTVVAEELAVAVETVAGFVSPDVEATSTLLSPPGAVTHTLSSASTAIPQIPCTSLLSA
jgi:hypothetical protein